MKSAYFIIVIWR